MERGYLLLGSSKILEIEHADFLAIRSLALDPVVGPVARYVNPVSGTNWEGTGVGPDIRVREELAVQAAYRAALGDVIQRTTSSREHDEIARQIEGLTKIINQP